MIRNYLKTAFRNLWKNKSFSFLNIFGLALGMACSLMILLWVQDEQKVDAFHAKKDRLYAVYEREYADGKVTGDYETPSPLAEALKKNISAVEMTSSFDWNDDYTFKAGDKTIKQIGGYAGQDFFRMFGFKLLQGGPERALADPSDIAISKSMAKLFFGSPEAAMGKTLLRDNTRNFKVSAVFEDLGDHSSLQFDFLFNWEVYATDFPWMHQWGNSGPLTLVLLKEGTSPASVEAGIKSARDLFGGKPEPGLRVEYSLQRFDEKYLHGNFKDGNIAGGRIEYVRLFSVVALFILLIACINFMNLTTARSLKRSREIGVRKVVGALRGSLIRQFLGEAVLQACISVIIALLLVAVSLPLFNQITEKHILMPVSQYGFWLDLAGLTILTGLVSGSYPAFFLSSFQPVRVLKGIMKFGSGATLFRRGLVVFQFVLSIVLMIGTIIVSQQVHYIQNKNLGYDRENLLYVSLDGDLLKKYELFKQEAASLPGITHVSRVNSSPTNMDNGTIAVEWQGKAPDFQPSFTHASVGYDFTRTMSLKFVEGRDFTPGISSDTLGFILNESAVKKIGYTNPVGKSLKFWGRNGTIIGVIEDFHFASLHDEIRPLILRFGEHEFNGQALIRIEAGKTSQALQELESLAKNLNPAFPFSYKFSDQEYQKLYKSEAIVGKLSSGFAFLAIFIAAMGLLGLAMFMAEQRTKEMSIRKVLGAGTGELATLLSRDFLKLVLIAILLAVPIAWWSMHAWLLDYAYRVDISPWVFVSAGAAALLITLLTISYQALKTAFINPAKNLRSE